MSMWDVFNKEKVEALTDEIQKLKDALQEKSSKLRSLENKLSEMNTENARLSEQSEKFRQGIDAVLQEFTEFLLHNRDKGLNYNNLDITRSVLNFFEDLNEYVLTIALVFKDASAGAIRSRFYNYISTVSIIDSYKFEVDHVKNLNHRAEIFQATLYIYTNVTLNKIENELLTFLYNRRVHIQDHQTEKDKITISGYYRDSVY